MPEHKDTNLEWTGERYVPQIRGTIALEHLHRYAFASEYVEGKVVLDIASGEGYGSEMLSRMARHVYGVDIDKDSVLHAQNKYKAQNLEYLVGSCTEIPLPDASVDVAISFETIEHITDQDLMMSEIKRVLTPGGILIISSPEKDIYDEINQKPNPFHLKELTRSEFQGILNKHFKCTAFLGQRVLHGSALIGIDGNCPVTKTYSFSSLPQKIETEHGLAHPVYIVAVCSDKPLSNIAGNLCEQSILENEFCVEQLRQVGALENSLNDLNNLITERDQWLLDARDEIEERDDRLIKIGKEAERAISDRDRRLLDAGIALVELEGIIIELQKTAREQDHMIANLDADVISMRSSVSWNITRPVRWLAAKIPRSIAVARKYYSAIRVILTHRKSGIFEPEWYLRNNPDVKDAGMNPWVHFTLFGIFEERAPASDFDPSAYLRKNPDIAKSSMGAVEHYITFGWREKRDVGSPDDLLTEDVIALVTHYREGFSNLSKEKKTILLVTHEISRTGAPILVLNLADKLRKHYNVVTLTLGGGTLLKEFEEASDMVLGPLQGNKRKQKFLTEFIREITALHSIDCAVVNSIVSTPILPSFWENGIPSAHLIHEFSSYTRPDTMFTESAFYSSRLVFSSKLVLENALQSHPHLSNKAPLVLPQGRCEPPVETGSPSDAAAERMRIDSLLRPAGSPDNLFIVIGLGTVQLRKGVDLFLECARRVSRKKSRIPIRFVWFGHGYNVELDGDYSVYLQDQIQRSGIEEMCAISHESNQLDHVYENTDLLFLSSRLDPLPLVSQDMMAHGKPVVCFDRATGIAEYLKQDPVASHCVVDFMDAEAAADLIVEFANNPEQYWRVGSAAKTLCQRIFNLDDYTEKLHCLCEELIGQQKLKNEDQLIIEESGLLKNEFFKYGVNPSGESNRVKSYMSLWSMGLDQKKPFPGFHPGIYAEKNGVEKRDPLADFILKERPRGDWLQEVITPKNRLTADTAKLRTALHLHLYYPEMGREIFQRIAQCNARPDLLISVRDQKAKEMIEALMPEYSLTAKRVAIVPNRGRNLGPLLTEFGQEIMNDYDLMGHLHTKKSLDLADREFVKRWTDFLCENLLGGEFAMMDVILSQLNDHPRLGLVFPDDPNIRGWSKNRRFAEELAVRMGLDGTNFPENINFPTGTMFWARTEALRPLFDLNLHWEEYPQEPLSYDGSILHAIERMLPLIAESMEYGTAVTNIPTITR